MKYCAFAETERLSLFWQKRVCGSTKDLTDYIRNVNGIKLGYKVFQEEAPTEFLHSNNPHVLLVWKASVATREEALFILNKDIHNRQHFYSDNLYHLLQARAPLVDVSPEYVLDHVATPFHYELRPGQGIVLDHDEGRGAKGLTPTVRSGADIRTAEAQTALLPDH